MRIELFFSIEPDQSDPWGELWRFGYRRRRYGKKWKQNHCDIYSPIIRWRRFRDRILRRGIWEP